MSADELNALREALDRPGATAAECVALATVAIRGYETMRRALAHIAAGCEVVQCLVARPGEMTAECRAEAPCVACLAAATVRHLRNQIEGLRGVAFNEAVRNGRTVDTGCSRDPVRFDICDGGPLPACASCGATEDGPCVYGVDPVELARATAAATEDGVVNPYALSLELSRQRDAKASTGDPESSHEFKRLQRYADWLARQPQ